MADPTKDGAVPYYDKDGNILGYEQPAATYGGGGGYGISNPSPSDVKAGKLLSTIANENAEILVDTYAAQIRVFDISDEMSRNLATKKICQAQRKAGQEWHASQQKLQAAAAQLADVASGALRSSLFYDYREMTSRADDQADTELLKTLRENKQEIEIALAEALMQTINSRNDLAANTEQQLRQVFTDWLAQLINIHPDLLSNASFTPTGEVIIDLADDVPAQAHIPGWINYEQWFEEHTTQAIQPGDAAKSRPDKASQMAWALGLLKDSFKVEGASDPIYLRKIYENSKRRTQ